ncbi:MAG: ABC transporter substrate-binding protein, partial [Candidatus Eremiobacteraeota bacterium]|nr:ABC transporter substrate-binding protein [Candidatus Eremiobacteraeota bacterium]
MIRSTFLTFAGGAAGATQLAQIAPYTATLRIAALCPQSGPDRALGLQLLDGVRASADEANRLRTTLDPVLIVTAFDDRNTPADAIVQGQFAANAPDVVAAIGHLSASATLAALQRYASAQIPLVVPTVTDDRVTAQGYRNIFRLPAKDSDEGRLVAGYVVQTGSRAPHVVTQDAD